jgi:general nucleoside transport system permease protein
MTNPLKFKLEKREQPTVWVQALALVIALLAAFLLSAALIATSGARVSDALSALYQGALGSPRAILETLVQSTPLLFTGLAMVVAFRGKVWNIGAEGQFFAGAIAATWVSLNFPGMPRPLLLVTVLLAACIGGALWGLLPGFLKARLGVNEIIITVMLNYVIRYVLSYLLTGPWTEPGDFFMQSPAFAASTFLPTFFNSRLHLGFFIALLLSVVIYFLLWKTPFGYAIRAIGDNTTAARYKGIKMERVIILVMLISGAIAGLAGGAELNGLHHRLRLDISTGYGFTGILIALLGRLNPFGVILAAIFFGALVNGSTAMQILAEVPVALVYSVQGIVLIFIVSADMLTRYRIRRVHE